MAKAKASSTEPPTDVEQLKELLSWLRAHRFATGLVQVGAASVQVVADLSLAAQNPGVPARTATNLMREMGGPLLQQMLDEQGGAEDEDEPALGRRQ